MIKRYVEVSFTKEGIHCWPGAHAYPDILFLASDHRHMFHIYVKVEVHHNDREIEFIRLKRELEIQYDVRFPKNLGSTSCEMIAEYFIEYIKMRYYGRDIVVRVYEDNENGAVLEYMKD